MQKEREKSLPTQKPETLKKIYEVGVIMPYSSDLDNAGKPILSIFSKFAVLAAAACYQNSIFKEILLLGEQTFGPDKESTSELMKKMLIRLHVPENVILQLPQTENLNNTVYQVKALSKYQENGSQSVLVVDFDFHDSRVKNHMKGYGVSGDTLTIENIVKCYFPKFNLEKFTDVFEKFQQREQSLCFLSKWDKKGRLIRIYNQIHGASVNNIEVKRTINGEHSLNFINVSARKRVKQMKQIAPNIS